MKQEIKIGANNRKGLMIMTHDGQIDLAKIGLVYDDKQGLLKVNVLSSYALKKVEFKNIGDEQDLVKIIRRQNKMKIKKLSMILLSILGLMFVTYITVNIYPKIIPIQLFLIIVITIILSSYIIRYGEK